MSVNLTSQNVNSLIRTREKFSHKGIYGHALLIAGSYGKMGAAVLSCKSCLRSGVGLLTVHVPKCGIEIMQNSVPEGMCEVDSNEKFVGDKIKNTEGYSAVGIGPGLGKNSESIKIIEQILDSKLPCVIDADALNLLSENRDLYTKLHEKVVLTPHPKEFERLTGIVADRGEQEKLQLEFSEKHGCVVVLKGAETRITTKNGEVSINTTGNPGMATGGSGDVLTGIILGLLAQGYSPVEAAKIGVFHHGLAGDKAAEFKGQNALIAGDLVGFLRIEKDSN